MNVKNNRVFVTGATGNIGVKLVSRLIDGDYEIYVLTRNGSKVNFDKRVKVIEADIFDIDKYKDLMCDCDYVYHLAVYQNIFDTNINKFEKVNVLGLKKILKVLKKSKIIKFFYVSTTMVFDNVLDNNYYVKTKIKALELVKSSGLPWVNIYPSIVVNLSAKSNSWVWNLITGG